MDKRLNRIFCVLLIAIFCAGCQGGGNRGNFFETTGFVMDTVFIQRLYGTNGMVAAQAAESRLHQLEGQLSSYQEGALVWQINEQAGIKPVPVEDELIFTLLQQAKAYSTSAPEIFNIAAGPLIDLWNIGKEDFRVPTESELLQAKAFIKIEDFLLDEATRTAYLRQKGERIDLGGIAKGMACDELKKVYAEQGVTQGIVSLGGNLLLLDGKPDGSDFEAGIRNPFGSSEEYIAVYQGRNTVIATSGSYERHSVQGGAEYSHVLDLRTGHPIENELAGVTVICSDGSLGDYLSTYIYIQGLSEGKRLLNDQRFGLILVDRSKNVYISPHIAKQVRITDSSFHLQEAEGGDDKP